MRRLPAVTFTSLLAAGCASSLPPPGVPLVAARRAVGTAVATTTPLLPPPAALRGVLQGAEPSTQPAAAVERTIVAATQQATRQPVPGDFDGAVQVYAYAADDVYEVVTSPGHVTTLELQPGERLLARSAGDTARWSLADCEAGGTTPDADAADTEGSRRTLVLVKPLQPGLDTNLVLATSQHVYRIALRSSADAYCPAVRWLYPHEALSESSAGSAAAVDPAVSLRDLDFGYRIKSEGKGDRPDWTPVRAFSDGRKTYIAFPRTWTSGGAGEAPPLFVPGQGGQAELVNYRVRGRYYIVEAVLRVAELRLGTDPQQVVRIERTSD